MVLSSRIKASKMACDLAPIISPNSSPISSALVHFFPITLPWMSLKYKASSASRPSFPSSWNFICPVVCIAHGSPSKNLCSAHHFTNEFYLLYRFLIKESSFSNLLLSPLPRTRLELYPFWPAPILVSRTAIPVQLLFRRSPSHLSYGYLLLAQVHIFLPVLFSYILG